MAINLRQMNTPLIDESAQEQRNLIQSTLPPIAAIELLKRARDELLAANPEARCGITFGSVNLEDLDVAFHGIATSEQACALLRRFGISQWENQEHGGVRYLEGKADGFNVTVFLQITESGTLKDAIGQALNPGF